MNFEKITAVKISEIEKQIENGNKAEALKQTRELWKTFCALGRNNEAIFCGSLHAPETLENARRENKLILSNYNV
tara:strand:- start:620 stop:844 length:225 start_codon:yes stop_codon:yes gene_type:complete